MTISVVRDEFEFGCSKYGKTKEHIVNAYTLGIKEIIICFTKIDSELVKFTEELYQEYKK